MKLKHVRKPLPISALALRVSALYIATYISLIHLVSGLGTAALDILLGFVPIVVGSVATAMAWYAWKASHLRQKKAWQWLTVGLGMWTSAEILAFVLMPFDLTGWLSWLPDLPWLLGYLPIAMCCIAFLRANHFELTPAKEIVAVIGGGILPMLVFVNFIHPFRGPVLVEVPPDLVIAALYPALDILIATGGLLCLIISGPKPWQRPWFYIGGGLVIFAYTDLWYWLLQFFRINEASVANAIRVDVPYGLAYVIVAVGCWQVIAEERLSRTQPINPDNQFPR
jgi:hypothetical protein